ncbi:hypothetical protein AB4347_06090 [Vibrio breoganii]
MNKIIISSVLLSATLVGCSTNSEKASATIEANSAVPVWVLNPSSANGLAASQCVEISGNFSADRNHAVALARNTLAQNIDVNVSVLEKTYQQLNLSADQNTTGSSFEQIAKQISNTSIQKSQVEQVALVTVMSKEQVCALVVIPTIESEKMFNEVVNNTGSINPDDRTAMYKEFVKQKTAEELQSQVQDL